MLYMYKTYFKHSDLGYAYIIGVYSLQNKCKTKNSIGG